MNCARPTTSTEDLLPSERRFLAAMQALGDGRFEFLQIRHGEVILDPWPTATRYVEVGVHGATVQSGAPHGASELKGQAAEFFEYILNFDAAEIRTLEVRGGLPVSMQVELAATDVTGGRP
ncbi:MAG: hypothetical protein ABSC05_23160 [Candidatus Solibacter sp.]